MGLAGAKSKRKLGNDPNNTKWSRNTETFGQKILRAQGWQPGDYLGAKDAPHAEWHTEANTTHIRVTLKDDTLGLGAKRNNGDECTGLDAFQHLLGRLNGKSDETLETERKAREDIKLNLYVEQKFGTIRFVRGGWLVGDQVKETPDEKAENLPNDTVADATRGSTEPSEAAEAAAVKSKKRKADQDADREDEKARKKEKKSKKRKTESDAEADGESLKEKKEKKDKKEKKSKSRKGKEQVAEDSAQSTSTAPSEAGETSGELDSSTEVSKAKKEKKEKKKDKKEKKEKKDKLKKDKSSSESGTDAVDGITKEKKRRNNDAASEVTPAESGISTPSGSGSSTPVPTGSSRYLARSRFIAQKRMAFTDSAALNQIFMIKS